MILSERKVCVRLTAHKLAIAGNGVGMQQEESILLGEVAVGVVRAQTKCCFARVMFQVLTFVFVLVQ